MPLASKCATSFSKQPRLQEVCCVWNKTILGNKCGFILIKTMHVNNYIFIYEKNANATFSKETHIEYTPPCTLGPRQTKITNKIKH
jgi:hypothetical protein